MWPFVVATVYRRLASRDRATVEDAAQEVFLRLLRLRPFDRVPDPDAFRAYLWKMADNAARTFNRKRRAEDAVRAAAVEAAIGDETIAPREEALELVEAMRIARAALSPDDKRLLDVIVSGGSLGQAAAALGLSYANAGVRLHRIRRKLRGLLEA